MILSFYRTHIRKKLSFIDIFKKSCQERKESIKTSFIVLPFICFTPGKKAIKPENIKKNNKVEALKDKIMINLDRKIRPTKSSAHLKYDCKTCYQPQLQIHTGKYYSKIR